MYWSVMIAGLVLPAQGTEFNEDQVRPLIAEVEAICGGRISHPPKVETVETGAFLAALKAELGDGYDPRKSRPLSAFYQPKTNKILFHRNGEGSELEALVISEVEPFRRMALFHELVHAWQYQPAFGEENKSPKILFTYKDKQYSVEYLTGVSDKEVTTVVEDNSSKYDLKSCLRPEGFWLFPGLSPWKPTGTATRRDYYQHQCQGLLEFFIEFETFNLYKQRHSADIKRYYRADLIEDAIRRKAELQDRFHRLMLSALDEKTSDAEVIEYLKKNFPMSNWNDRDWTESLNGRSGFKRYRPYYAFNARCFPWMVGGKPAPWVEHYCYSKLIRYHIQAEIERDKTKYVQILEGRFGTFNYFVIRNAQDSDKVQLLNLINLVTNRKGEIAKGGLEKVNKTLQDLNSPTRMDLGFGNKLRIAKFHKIPEDRIKSRRFLSLGKTANGMESYLYIFQEEPTSSSKEDSSAPGTFLYSTAMHSLLGPLVEEVRAAIKPAKGVTLRSTDQIVTATGGGMAFFDKMFGVKLPKVVLVPE